MILLRLYYEFFKIGLFAVGGGLATIPFLKELAWKSGWFTIGDLMDLIAVSESTPGPIGVNMATYVGFLTGGIGGAVVATLGLITPCVIVILLVARVLNAFRDSKYVSGAFYGLRPASTAMIAAALLRVVRITFFADNFSPDSFSVNWKAIALMAVLVVLTRYTPKVKQWHPIVFILFSAVVGAIFSFAGV